MPKFLWRPVYRSTEDLPGSLKLNLQKDHPRASLEDYNEALAGKIIIPQPFGKLKNLYTADSGCFLVT